MKPKILIAIVILVLGAAAVSFALTQKKKAPASQKPVVTQTEQPQAETPKEEQPAPVSVINLTGTVSTVEKDSIEITNEDIKNTITLADKVEVISVNKTNIEKKELKDIKKGQNVSLMINQADSKVISIQILEAGSEAVL